MNESEADEDDKAGDKVDDEADGALRVQADQHHALPAESVRQRPEDDTAEADAAKVECGCQGGQIMAVANQIPLKEKWDR